MYVSNLTTVELLLFVQSQFTTSDAQAVLNLNQCTHRHV